MYHDYSKEIEEIKSDLGPLEFEVQGILNSSTSVEEGEAKINAWEHLDLYQKLHDELLRLYNLQFEHTLHKERRRKFGTIITFVIELPDRINRWAK